jgi:hypothetical protein
VAPAPEVRRKIACCFNAGRNAKTDPFPYKTKEIFAGGFLSPLAGLEILLHVNPQLKLRAIFSYRSATSKHTHVLV